MMLDLELTKESWDNVDKQYKEDVFDFMLSHFDALLDKAIQLKEDNNRLEREMGELVGINHELLKKANII